MSMTLPALKLVLHTLEFVSEHASHHHEAAYPSIMKLVSTGLCV